MLYQGILETPHVSKAIVFTRATLGISTFREFDSELRWFSCLIVGDKALTRTDLEEAKLIRRLRRPNNQSLDVTDINITTSHGKRFVVKDEPMTSPISKSTPSGDVHRSEFF